MDNNSEPAECAASSSVTPMEVIESNGDGSSEELSGFSSSSIDMKASAIGIKDLSKDVLQYIADELSYKMRELIYTSKFIMSRNKRTTLSTNDVKKAMQLLGGCEIFGHSTKEPCELIHIPGRSGEMDLFVEGGPVIDVIEVALEETTYEQRPECYIQGAWVMPESSGEEPMSSPINSSYYRTIAKTIMAGSPAHIRVALKDLRTNPKIGPLCPYFLNLVALIVKRVAPTVKQDSRNINLTNTLISTIHAIAHNRYVDPSPYYPVNRAVDSLLKIVIETNVGPAYDDLAVRFRAGLLLAKVVITWSIELKQQMDIVRSLLQHLLDPKRPLQSHYGAIVALTALGQRTTTYYFWPVIERYLPQLELRAAKDPDVMVQHVMAAILVAARSTHHKEPTSVEQLLKLYRVDQMLYYMFGDSVTPLRMATNSLDQVYPVAKSATVPTQTAQYRLRVFRVALSSQLSRRKPPVPFKLLFDASTVNGSAIGEPEKPLHWPGLFHHGDRALGVAQNKPASTRVIQWLKRCPQKRSIDSLHHNQTRCFPPRRLHFCYVVRKPKFTRRFHRTCTSGDLLLML